MANAYELIFNVISQLANIMSQPNFTQEVLESYINQFFNENNDIDDDSKNMIKQYINFCYENIKNLQNQIQPRV